MDDLYYCIRIMQISTEKLQSPRYYESLYHTSLIRSTFLQSRKYLCDFLHSFIKISSTTNTYLPTYIQNDNRNNFLSYEQKMITLKKPSSKRKSCHVDNVKRLRVKSP
ncbi:unnamed protein product [Rotaria sp. Silwood1]|nr:unnamed protein product [Rotaria sp. Silwood1]CAF1544252.1 unnamed protein product [Rotaria sp. Silwood1]CAF3736290.1 unnamed protein product [Rotaria sp. Silwood1]CAF3769291.1 unnamed protein product [Rotaria sp. Silwood1]CAF4777415.1 unnamed protein product [Rotaria sp. Silwood1]